MSMAQMRNRGTKGDEFCPGPTVQAGPPMLGHRLAFSWQGLGTKGWTQLELTARSSLTVTPALPSVWKVRSGRRGPSSREGVWDTIVWGALTCRPLCWASRLGLCP